MVAFLQRGCAHSGRNLTICANFYKTMRPAIFQSYSSDRDKLDKQHGLSCPFELVQIPNEKIIPKRKFTKLKCRLDVRQC